MPEHRLDGIDGSDPLGFLAALGLLVVATRECPSARLCWRLDGLWRPVLLVQQAVDLDDVVMRDHARLRAGHPAVSFAEGADRKVQDLKHPPEHYRDWLRALVAAGDDEALGFAAAYGTGVAIDGTGQSKPTSFHFAAGQQRFMSVVLSLLEHLQAADVTECLEGPWSGREGAKSFRWRAGSERLRALLAFDPGATAPTAVAGAEWLAFRALPLFPSAPVGLRRRTTGFTGGGKSEVFWWSIWEPPLSVDGVRSLVGWSTWPSVPTQATRDAVGISAVFRAPVTRAAQGYGNFAAAEPV